MLNSDDLRLFLAALREGNMVAAGKRCAVDPSTVARRLTALEEALGTRLFERSPRGLRPTPAAEALADHAERIEAELNAAVGRLAGRDREVEGTVRLTAPEGFGSWLVAPRLARLRARHPALTLELVSDSRATSLARREADLAVMLRPPPRGRLITRRLLDYRLGLYGAPAYLAEMGTPASREDLAAHRYVSYIDELAGFPEMIALDAVVPQAPVVFRATSAAAQTAAVAGGLGLGMLHLFASAGNSALVPVLPTETEVWRSYWLVLHADVHQLPRVRAVIGFLDEIARELRGRV